MYHQAALAQSRPTWVAYPLRGVHTKAAAVTIFPHENPLKVWDMRVSLCVLRLGTLFGRWF